jgi:hypothetical protein
MKVLKVFSCILLILSFFVSPSYALILESISGSWDNPVGGDPTTVNYSTARVAYGSGLESRILYGSPAGGYQGGLGFTGAPAPSVFDVGDIFELGQLRHLNTPTLLGTAINGVDMLLSMSFTDPVGAAVNFGFSLSLLNTLNVGGGSLDNDFLYFPAFFAAETFVVDGKRYALELIGFGPDSSSLLSQLQTSENAWSCASLWGRITSAPVAPVPEPATLILLGSGVLVLAGARIRLKK